jgi:hypothetical protein
MDFDGKLSVFLIYFRPTSDFGMERLVKNNKLKMMKSGIKQQIIQLFLPEIYQIPNLHQVHINT